MGDDCNNSLTNTSFLGPRHLWKPMCVIDYSLRQMIRAKWNGEPNQNHILVKMEKNGRIKREWGS